MPIKFHIEAKELFDDRLNEFRQVKAQDVTLEHSLISISKWESKWHKPFLDSSIKTRSLDESYDYIRMMSLDPNVNPDFVYAMTTKQMKELEIYITDPMTATTIKYYKNEKRPNRELVTSELIYFWMTAYQIPFTCEKWHINRLMKLIELCAVKNDPEATKGMAKNDILRSNYNTIMSNRAKMGLKK